MNHSDSRAPRRRRGKERGSKNIGANNISKLFDRRIEEDRRSNPATVVLALLLLVVVVDGGVVGALSNVSLTVVEATPY